MRPNRRWFTRCSSPQDVYYLSVETPTYHEKPAVDNVPSVRTMLCCESHKVMRPPTRFVFLGAPGVGKGSFASIIGPQLGLATVGVGDLVRDEVKQGSVVGKQLKAFSDRGQLAPDDAINRLVNRRLEQPDASRGFILDGFPRNLAQAAWLESSGIGVDRVVNITLPEWVAVVKSAARRSCSVCGRGFNVADVNEDGFEMPKILPDFDSCGGGSRCPGSIENLETREDDTADIIRQRLAVYRSETAPLIDFYEAKGLLKNFPVRRGIRDKDTLVDVMVAS